MQTSVYIAKLLGPVIAIAGLGFLFNRQAFLEMARDFLNSTGLIVISGFLALPIGLAIVNVHNVWVAGWPVIITIFGWLAIIAGVMRITMPGVTRTIAERMLDLTNFITIEAVILIALGAWLCYVGYIA